MRYIKLSTMSQESKKTNWKKREEIAIIGIWQQKEHITQARLEKEELWVSELK